MHTLHRLLITCLVLVAVGSAPAMGADKGEFRPKPETYICPNVSTLGVDCYLDAVDHLYTMCRQVKHIELIEFGVERAEEGVNGAKSEYCVDKHKASINRPYQAALREARGRQAALDALQSLHELWLGALSNLKLKPAETDVEYHARVAEAYGAFHERASIVRTALLEAPKGKAKPAAPPRRTASAAAHAVH